ncbi:MAG: hypothetical protein RR087_05580 [Oscillospiraceae bacterium]
MKNTLKKAMRFSAVFVLMIIGLICFKTLVSSLPEERIHTHVQNSIPLLEQEKMYPQPFISNPAERYLTASTQFDSVTEFALMNVAYRNNPKTPLISAMKNASYAIMENEDIQKLSDQSVENLESTELSTYWLGASSIYSILLFLMPLAGARQFLLFTFSILFLWFLYATSRKINTISAFAIAIGMFAANIWIVPFSVAFSITFYIAFGVGLYILYSKKRYSQAMLFFVTGILTAFFDWLSTPILTFALPALLIVLISAKNDAEYNLKKSFCGMLGMGSGWVAGYVLTVLSKWIIGSVILQENLFERGFSRIGAGLNKFVDYGPQTSLGVLKGSLKVNLKALYPISNLNSPTKTAIVLSIVFICVIIMIVFHKKADKLWLPMMILLVGLAPYVWFAAFKGHCFIHFWFTYRSQAVSVAAFFIAYSLAVDHEKFTAFHKKNKDKFHQIKINAFKKTKE